ncbi:FimV/HubP family polar landmark protein [Aquisalimonas lutea]|uniref:FimV/HubP family polar landmark protein n=1 Tax=Aquisalimonas lutea TaxID=1327750 RepID=UPI0025B4D054|nr:FimV/HubP family polar landmark protein [Aquisalimonas lutea]MDN3517750.1 FimV/HubP family polar landmark protein [Aquisalimonas lutea]
MARRLVRIAALTTVFAPSFAVALGLGSIETESALNEPLEARIPLQSADVEEVRTLNATLASPEAFDRAGLERPFTLSRLEFEVVTEGVREPYLAIRTSEAVREPFLAFLVELNWAGGRLIREYTMLLDPPVHSPEEESGAAVAEGDAPSDARSREGEGQPSATAGRSRPEDVAEAGAPQQIEVRSNDTLWEIAEGARPDDGVSVHQMMMALLEANPEAFTNGNVNNLRAGAVLQVPDREETQVLSAGEARQRFAAQVEAWQSGRAPEPSQEPPQEEQVAEETPEPGEGRLEVVAAGETSGSNATASLMEDDLEATPENVERLQSQVAALRESEASLRSENEELRQQTDELMERVEALERTLDIQVEGAVPGMPDAAGEDEPELAQGQDDASADEADAAASADDAEGAASDAEAAASADAADAPDMAAAEEAGGQPGDTAADTAADDGEAASDEAAMASADTTDEAAEEGAASAGDGADEEAADTEQPTEEAAAEEETAAAGEEEPAEAATGTTSGPLAALWQNPRSLGLGAAGVLALSVLALLVVRRRRNAAEDASASVAAASELDEAAAQSIGVPAEEAGQPAAGEESTAQDAPTEPRGDVDPLEEIEVYMAYGRYDQARDLLATAVAGEPERKDLRLKQLEIHALTHDRGGFETDAQELYALVDGPDDPVWQQAREMGREIAPEHPLFAEDGGNLRSPAMASEPAPAVAEEPVASPETVEPASGGAAADEATDEDDFGDLDFSLDDTDEAPAGAPAAAREEPAPAEGEGDADDAFSLDFDLEDFQAPAGGDEAAPAADESAAAPAAEEPADDDFSLDFEAWGTDTSSEEAPAAGETAEADEATEDDDDAPTYSLDDLDLGGEDDAEAEEEGLRYDGLPESDAEASAGDDDLSFAADDAPGEEPGETEAEVAQPVEQEASAGGEQDADDADDDLFDAGDENSTKLDLARAYLDMGDSEGARSLLDEVIQEGSDEQKAEAESLYDQAR